MMNLLKYTGIILLLLIGVQSRAQTIKASASIDTAGIIIGDQVRMKLMVEFPKEVKVTFPVPSDTLHESVEIVDRKSIDSIFNDAGNRIMQQEFTISSFDTGRHEIAPFEFALSYEGMQDTLRSNPLALHVFTIPKLDSLMNAFQGPIDIKPPYEAPITLKEVAPWILGILIAAGLIFLIVWAIMRRKRNQPIFSLPQKPKEPAHIIALRKLDKVKEEKIWQQGRVKEYYSAVTDAVREYIENRFEINALEQTSDETIALFAYRKDLLDNKTLESLKKMLSNADLVKFAKLQPGPDENNLLLVDAYFFVNQTKQEVKKEARESDDDREGEEVFLN